MNEEQEKKIDVRLLGPGELTELSDDQVNLVRAESLRRKNPEVYKRMSEALKGKNEEIIRSLVSPPFCFVSDEIEIRPGIRVKFRSLFSWQSRHISEAASASRQDAYNTAQAMNKMFLVHGIDTLNGEHFGNVVVPAGESDPTKEAIEALVAARLRAIAVRPEALIQLLMVANSMFQELYDDAVSLRGPKGPDGDKAREVVEAVGKSTGPQVAGQKQT